LAAFPIHHAERRAAMPSKFSLLLSLPVVLLAAGSASAQGVYEFPPWTSVLPQESAAPMFESPPPPPEAPRSAQAVPASRAPAAPAQPEPAVKLWEGNFELGLNGSEGNSETFNFRFGAEGKRQTDDNVLTLDLDYHRDTSHSVETAHRLFFDWRYEWLFKESPWTWFAHGSAEYDEFKAFDLRVSLDTGLGYQFLKTERTSFLGRMGGGWSREFGGPDDRYVPEAVLGADFAHRFSPRQKFTASVDYTPDVTDFADWRLNTKAAWDVVLDEAMNLSLKVSVLDRYDSTPHGAKPNDVDYAVTLLWSF
jgi:putative salt-induced outer membrane protein YdiY